MASTAAPSPRQGSVPSLDEIRDKSLQVLGCRPCLWQCRVIQALLRGDRDVVCVSGTGSGKTITFWIPLLFRRQGIQFVITPLNLLGSQNARQLEHLGIMGVALSGKTATPKNFEVLSLKVKVSDLHGRRHCVHSPKMPPVPDARKVLGSAGIAGAHEVMSPGARRGCSSWVVVEGGEDDAHGASEIFEKEVLGAIELIEHEGGREQLRQSNSEFPKLGKHIVKLA